MMSETNEANKTGNMSDGNNADINGAGSGGARPCGLLAELAENESNGSNESAENKNKEENNKEENEFADEQKRVEKLLKKTALKKKHSVMRAFALVGQLGLQTAGCVVGSMLLGVFLDRRLGTMPLFLIILSVLGSAASVMIIYNIAKDWDD